MDRPTELRLPELELAGPVHVSVWLVEPGAELSEGDGIVEIVAGDIAVELPSPVAGKLVEQCASEGDTIETNQLLGWIQRDA